MTREQRNEQARQKRQEWKAEIHHLRNMQGEREEIARKKESRRLSLIRAQEHDALLLAKIHEELRGAGFKAWYEATTGEDVSYFLCQILITPYEYSERFRGSKFRMSQLDWTKNAIEMIALKNPWTNPELKKHWHSVIQNTKDPKERRAVLIRLATPRWANQDKMVEVYLERDRLSEKTGVPHEVDHIIPIVNKRVCGLHCEFNLRVIPRQENRTKSNKFNHESF